MHDLLLCIFTIVLQLNMYLFMFLWEKEVVIFVYRLYIGVTALGATLVLILSFGTHETVIRYRIPYEEEVRELIIRIP